MNHYHLLKILYQSYYHFGLMNLSFQNEFTITTAIFSEVAGRSLLHGGFAPRFRGSSFQGKVLPLVLKPQMDLTTIR